MNYDALFFQFRRDITFDTPNKTPRRRNGRRQRNRRQGSINGNVPKLPVSLSSFS